MSTNVKHIHAKTKEPVPILPEGIIVVAWTDGRGNTVNKVGQLAIESDCLSVLLT
jgi:hypothetical protein